VGKVLGRPQGIFCCPGRRVVITTASPDQTQQTGVCPACGSTWRVRINKPVGTDGDGTTRPAEALAA
jgi:hypothetical protein